MYIISISLLLYVQKHATASYDSVCKRVEVGERSFPKGRS